MKGKKRRNLYKKQHICTKAPKKWSFVKRAKTSQQTKAGRATSQVKTGKNPKVQLSTSLMKVLRQSSVLIQTGAWKGQKYEFNHKVRLQ